MTAYRELENDFRRIGHLDDAAGMLHWDAAAMMPAGGAEARAEQLATLSVLGHELICDPHLAERLDLAETEAGLNPWQAANLREMRRLWRHATSVSAQLVDALSRATSRCEMAWRTARPANDFAGLAPLLSEVLVLVRETAVAKANAFGCTPYDALLDQYEPGARAETIDALFNGLAGFLPDLVGRALEARAARPTPQRPDGPFPVARQRELARRLMTVAGFDFDHGRLDVSDHPFCAGIPDDVRITTRYDENDFMPALMGVLHETGHALYERGLPAAWRAQPVGRARGMGLHESQSLLIEMQVCRSRAFIEFAAPLMREAFSGTGPAWEAENLYRLYVGVAPGLIRVDADEVTYPAHILLRTRVERAMIDGALAVADLPGAWAEGMTELLGLTPPDDRDGCLQDVHWPDGAFGYFPTYTIGAMTAAQLFDAARRADSKIESGLARGDFAPLRAWLADHVHGKGSLLGADELLTEATGRPLEVAPFRAHLEARYLG
ncbi:MAG: carboxypeptidase M32 [Alphaproteobacteria bacterium]